MKWRFLRLDFKYAIGELVIVTAGVLIALWVDQWRQEVSDSQLEDQYALRLIADLQEDINRFDSFNTGLLAEKIEFLIALENLEMIPDELDVEVFDTRHLRAATVIAIPEAQATTYREMESSGNMRLIEDEELRVALEDYYDTHALLSGILSQPIGDFRKIMAQSIPGSAYLNSFNGELQMPEEKLLEALSSLLAHPEYRGAVNAELYYASSMLFYLSQFIEDAKGLRIRLSSIYE